MRILIVEDDQKLSAMIKNMLVSASFIVDNCESAIQGFEFARAYEYKLIILDLMLPDMDGYEWLKKLRQINIITPVLILSSLTQKENIVKGLGVGADDYLTKPFDKRELIARIHALIRRNRGIDSPKIKIGDLTLDLIAKKLKAKDQIIDLTYKEYISIELLFLRNGDVLSKETFIDQLYNGLKTPQPKIIDVLICNLRRKIAYFLPHQIYIETVWGRGYTLRHNMHKRVKLKKKQTNNILQFKARSS